MRSPATYKGVAIGITIVVHALLLVLFYLPSFQTSPFLSDESAVEILPQEEIEQLILDLNLLASPPARGSEVATSRRAASESKGEASGDALPLSEGASVNDLKGTTMPTDSTGRVHSQRIERVQPLLEQKIEPETAVEPEIKMVLDSAMMVLAEQIQQRDKQRHDYTKSRAERMDFYRENYRTIYNFMKVYSYALMIKDIMVELDTQLVHVANDRERRVLIKKTEKELFDQFEKIVRKMTYSQGKVLLKLIARETGQSTYDIIKNYKGSLTAGFWYNVGRLFTANLKVEYDKEGEDKVLEEILQRSEKGEYLLIDKGVYLY